MSDASIHEKYRMSLTLGETWEEIPFNGTSTESTTSLKPDRAYRFISDQECHIKRGATGLTATSADMPLGAWSPEVFHTPADSEYFLAVIQASAAGSLWITELDLDRI